MTAPWDKKVFIISEIGINHNGDVDIAKELIREASKAKVDAVKFQIYRTENILAKIPELMEWYKSLKSWELTLDEFKELKKYSEKKGVLFFSSFFDTASVDLVDELVLDLIKVPSGELTNHLLLEKIAEKKKNIILSTGMSKMSELRAAVEILKSSKNLALLHCVSAYPAKLEDANLLAMETLKKEFSLPVGLSDHTMTNYAAIAAVALGARIIEKHFTLSRDMNGPDHKSSIEPEQLKELVETIRALEKGFGDGIRKPAKVEMKNRYLARKGLVFMSDMKKGQEVRRENLGAIRPERGISVQDFKKVIGKKLKLDVSKGDVVDWEKLS